MKPSNDPVHLKHQALTARQLSRINARKIELSFEQLALEYWGVEYAMVEYGHPLDFKAMVKDCKESIQSSFDRKLKDEDFLNLMLSVHFGIEASKIKDCEYVEYFDPRFGDRWILSFDTDSEVLTDILQEEIKDSRADDRTSADSHEAELNTFNTQADAYRHANENFGLFERYCSKMHLSTDAAFEVLRG